LEKSRAELERQRQLQKTEFDRREAQVQTLENEGKLMLKELQRAQALDEEYRRQFPQLFDPSQKTSFPNRIK